MIEAVISHGSEALVTRTSVPVKVAPQVSPYEQDKVQPAIGVNV